MNWKKTKFNKKHFEYIHRKIEFDQLKNKM